MKTFTILLLLSISLVSHAEVINKKIQYTQGDTVMHGLLTYDDSFSGKRPGILVVHEWWGQNSYARIRARMLAKLGYTALAVDMYGDGKTADHPKDAGAFSSAVGGNLPLARARFEAAMKTLKQHSTVDDKNIAAIGYCFGGGIALQMARLGVDIKGVASFHGSLASNIKAEKGKIRAAIRVFNGAADPFVKAEHVAAFEKEMSAAGVNYKVINYESAKHSFTNPEADTFGKRFNLPLQYNETADKDSWQKMQEFFKEIF